MVEENVDWRDLLKGSCKKNMIEGLANKFLPERVTKIDHLAHLLSPRYLFLEEVQLIFGVIEHIAQKFEDIIVRCCL